MLTNWLSSMMTHLSRPSACCSCWTNAVVGDDAKLARHKAVALGQDVAIGHLKVAAQARDGAVAAALHQPVMIDADAHVTHAQPFVGDDPLLVIQREVEAHILDAEIRPGNQRVRRLGLVDFARPCARRRRD